MAENIITDLNDLDVPSICNFVSGSVKPDDQDFYMNDILIKTVCVTTNYKQVAAVVDLLVIFLLQRLGFYSERFFVFPKFPLQIYFKGNTMSTVLDLFSFFRMFVVKKQRGNKR